MRLSSWAGPIRNHLDEPSITPPFMVAIIDNHPRDADTFVYQVAIGRSISQSVSTSVDSTTAANRKPCSESHFDDHRDWAVM